ncbi:MAG TPA: peptidylprolyl isomerase [Candidatus Acidoferrales bacterium]|nr:peptidylprolyl isomerase [Candidatus Acidoferrales bacterium]
MTNKLALLAAFAACVLAGSCRNQGAPNENVWAVVNGTQIQRAEVEKFYRSRQQSQGALPSHDEALSLELSILDQLINNEILYQRAQALNLVATDAEVEDKFTESKSPFTEDEFQKKLQENGLSVDDLKSEIRRELTIEKLLNREVVAKISITDADVADYYSKNQSQFSASEPQYHVAQILVTPHADPGIHNRKNDDATTPEQAKKKVDMLEAQLASGADFTQLAMDYSEDANGTNGGDLGFIPQSSLNQTDAELKKSVLSLQPGQASKPILLKDGYHIIKLLAREPAGQQQLSDPQVQQNIRGTLKNRKEQLLRSAYLMAARDQARVTNYLAREILESAGKLPEMPAAVKR